MNSEKIVKNLILVFLIFQFNIGFLLSGFTQNSFEIILEGEGESFSNVAYLIESSDGNFIGKHVLQHYNDTLNTWDEYLIKITPDGNFTTSLFHKKDTTLFFTKVIQVHENPIQYFVSGLYFVDSLRDWEYELFMLVDENFEIIWEKKYKLSSRKSGFSSKDVMQLADGSFLYVRRPSVISYMYLFHLSADGDSLCYKSYEGDSAGQVMCLTYSPDSSSYWLHTRMAHYDPTGPESQVIEINDQLEQTKVMYYPRWFSENYYAKVLPNNKLLAGGRYFDIESTYLTTYILDTALNVIHDNNLTNPDTNIYTSSKCIDYYYPDQIFVGGTHNNGGSWEPSPSWLVVAKYDQELDLIYEHYIGGEANYRLFNVTATSDSGVLIAGTRYDYDELVTKKKAIIIKLNKEGILVGKEDNATLENVTRAIVYPNPGNSNLFLRTALKNTIFTLYDMNGNVVLKNKINQLINEFDTEYLHAGMYTWTIHKNKKLIESGKWLKQNRYL
jgi:hypothetical protein